MNRRLTATIAAATVTVGALALAIGASSGSAAPSARSSATTNLVGTFKLKPGRFANGKATGTYFRMILHGGGYFTNPDSTSSDKTYTLGTPGSDGGLVTGRYQAPAGASFDAKGNALASRIVRPQSFTGIDFSVATPAVDPQTKKKVPAPVIRATGRKLSGQVTAFAAEWNNNFFNQGAPKPDGSGSALKGSYNPKTRHFVLTWTSLIKGGPFNSFSGFWHFEGTFKPAH